VKNGAHLFLIGILCAATIAAEGPAAPVLVELFTSEGCSSCPPADRLLSQLDSQAVVLGFHVDYWDHEGWKDRFSSHAFAERQQVYADRLHAEGPYTPQMVVDGSAEFVGSDAQRAATEISKAAKREKTEIKLTRTPAGLHVEVPGPTANGEVMLALAENTASSDVRAGENKGRVMQHVAPVRSLQRIGAVKRGASFRNDVPLPASAAGQRVVVFIQDAPQGRITGAAMLRP
jgi:hypothetical protein